MPNLPGLGPTARFPGPSRAVLGGTSWHDHPGRFREKSRHVTYGTVLAARLTMACVTIRRKRRSPFGVAHPPAARRFVVGAVLSACGLLSWSCGGNVAGSSPVDASSGADGWGVADKMVDASTDVLDSDARDTDAATPADASTKAAVQCHWPESLNDAGPGACTVGRAYVVCHFPSGAGCLCISDDPTSCPNCGPVTGATCQNVCAQGEYAVSCGGPPIPIGLPDGGFGSYQKAPDGCTGVGATPGGNLYSCCPCE